ncbi:hypothetical protein [Thermococcus sp. 21S7]|uniref:hypothetical protein n=1 Tax=Thermococcus sp. 21S7 TaxID=1638221 RepID=UPI00143A7911|nr:hypothetical protein [Thermococcus sp. 21S7]NJE61698.1 hypothetical protein [Thermococcus sp. 21S7]
MDEGLLEVKRLLSEGKPEEALRKAAGISDPYWRSYALRWVAEAHSKDPEKAVKIAESIRVPSIRDETLRSLAYLFSKSGKFREALEVARKIKNQFLRKKALRAVSNFLARSIISKGVTEIRLSDLNLDERDIEDLKPLPYGLIYRDGKIMPGAKILPLKGEVREGVIERFEKLGRRKIPAPEFQEESNLEYVSDYVLRLIEKGSLTEAENLARGLPEPMKSYLLEEIGIRFLESGLEGEAERIFGELTTANVLGSMLARKRLNDPDAVIAYLGRIHNPATRLMLAYEVTKKNGLNEKFLSAALMWATDEWKKGRILKFLAFEMLEEAKRTGDERLRRISRELFELGRSIEREYRSAI